jgi:hypothetical protein
MTIYIYSIFIPVLILFLGYYFSNPKPKSTLQFINLIFKMLPHLYGYMFFLYYIGREQGVRTGGADLGFGIFFVPISVVIILIKLFYWFRELKSN